MKEVKEHRYAGPYEEPPYEEYIESPMELVPKDGGMKTRLVFHLSYPRTGASVNSGIPKEKCSVKYPDFEEAVKLCQKYGKADKCVGGKSDMSIAFLNVPLRVLDFLLLLLKAEHPTTGKIYFFVDKCLPFSASISCAIFQKFSDSVSYLVTFRTKKENINYLDDFFFVAWLKMLCNCQVNTFLEVCSEINFPVSLEKIFWATERLIFLGLPLDMERQLICILLEKIVKALEFIRYFLNENNKKATVLQLQKLTGFLNFLGRCIIPGRAFTRRMYTYIKLKRLQHHHIRIMGEL